MTTPVDEIKSRLDVVDIVREYVPLKQAGANFKANCPFHQESTPSFMVSRAKQIWHCFGCGLGGDMFTFLEQIEGVEFAEALRILAKKAGVQLKREDPRMQNERNRMYDLQRDAARFFHAQLLQSSHAGHVRQYIQKRGLTKETVETWRLGWSPDGWEETSQYLLKKGYTRAELAKGGLIVEKQENRRGYYDRFRNRLMFPILDHNGNFIGFTARILDAEEKGAKYINTPDSPVYDKSRVLYGLYNAKKAIRQAGVVVIVEGNMDVVASHAVGVENVVASSGTALTETQLTLLKRFAETIVLAFDVDTAGQTAAERGIELAWQMGFDVKVARRVHEEAKDPDDLIRVDPELWKQSIAGAQNVMDHMIGVVFKDADPASVDFKKKAAKKLLPLVGKLENEVEKDHYIHELSDRLRVSEDSLRQALKKTPVKKTPKPQTQANEQKPPAPVREMPTRRDILSERLLALLLIIFQEDRKPEIVHKEEWVTPQFKVLYRFVVSYYNDNSSFAWANFFATVQEEMPEQRKLWEKVSLISEDIKSQLPSSNEYEKDLTQVVQQLSSLSNQSRTDILRRELETIEADLAHEKDEHALADLRHKAAKLLEEIASLQ